MQRRLHPFDTYWLSGEAVDTFLLARLAQELSEGWTGAWVQGVWQDQDGRLILRLRRSGETAHLVLSPLSQASGLGLLARRPACPDRPPTLASYLRAHARGSRLEAARTLPFERVVELTLNGADGSVRVYLETVGRRGNLLVVDAEGRVRAAWRWETPDRSPLRPVVPGSPYRPPPDPRGIPKPDAVRPEVVEEWLACGEPLHRKVSGLSAALAREVAHRATRECPWKAFRAVVDTYGDAHGPVFEYGVPGGVPGDRPPLASGGRRMARRSSTAAGSDPARALRDGSIGALGTTGDSCPGAPGVLSALPLTHLGAPSQRYPQALRVAGQWLEDRLAATRDQEKAKAARQREKRFRERLARRLERIEIDLDRLADPAELRNRADALGANLWRVKPGDRRLEVPDPRRPERSVVVELDPALPPGENLGRLYQRARRTERSREALLQRLRETRRELEQGPSADEGAGEGRGTRGGKTGPFRRYVSSDGWAIWVGRNGIENDRLLRESRPWDIWLHARESSGAHVLVRKPGKEARAPQRTLIEAAGLAALYSGRARDGAVEVMVAEAARVRKPKGASPGRVVVTGERTLRVPPGAGNPRSFEEGRRRGRG